MYDASDDKLSCMLNTISASLTFYSSSPGRQLTDRIECGKKELNSNCIIHSRPAQTRRRPPFARAGSGLFYSGALSSPNVIECEIAVHAVNQVPVAHARRRSCSAVCRVPAASAGLQARDARYTDWHRSLARSREGPNPRRSTEHLNRSPAAAAASPQLFHSVTLKGSDIRSNWTTSRRPIQLPRGRIGVVADGAVKIRRRAPVPSLAERGRIARPASAPVRVVN